MGDLVGGGICYIFSLRSFTWLMGTGKGMVMLSREMERGLTPYFISQCDRTERQERDSGLTVFVSRGLC